MHAHHTHIVDVLKLATGIALAIIALEIIFAIKTAFLIFFTAIILAIAMEHPITSLSRRSVPRTHSAILLYASVFVSLLIVLSLTLPAIASELRNFVTSYPSYSEAILGGEETIERDILPYIKTISESVTGNAETLISTTFRTFGGLTSFLAVFFIAFFLNIQKGGVRSFIYPCIPTPHMVSAIAFLDRVQDKVSNWLWGKAISSLIVALLTLVGLLLFDIPYAIILAVLAFFLNFIPFIGPIIASIPSTLLGFTHSPATGIAVALYYFFVNGILESFIFGPLLMKRAIQVNPALLILFVISGAYLGGVFGIIIAIPTSAIIYLAITEYMQKKQELASSISTGTTV